MAMVYCQHCRAKIDEDEVFCPQCELSLVGEDVRWQRFKLRESVYRAERRSDVYTALATVLATLGLVGGIILGLMAQPLGLLGIAFLCLGVGFGSMARRHDRKADGLRQWLRRCH
ncbi:MAG: hypothetical protein ACNA7X_02355 [Dehalococcoidia bacterium]